MKFLCEAINFQNVIQNSYDFCSQKVLSTTSFVLLDLKGNILNIRTTDGKMGFDATLEVDGKKDGSITVPCEKFLNIIKTFSNEKILIEQKDSDYITIKSDSRPSSFKIKFNFSSTFPDKENIDIKEHIEIGSKELIKAVKQAVLSISVNVNDDTKAVFNGVLLEKKNNKIFMISTDGKSMSYVESEIEKKSNMEDKSAIIPSQFLKEIEKIFKNDEILDIYLKDNIIFVRNDDTIIYSGLYKGSFPNYRKVLDAGLESSIIYKVEDMNKALKSVVLMTDNISKKVILTIKPGVTIISATDNELGSASYEIASEYDGEEVKFALNSSYLVNQVKAVTSDYLKIQFTNGETHIKIQPTNEDSYTHIIMPMSLN